MIEVMLPQVKKLSEAGENPGTDPSLGPSRGHGSVHPLILDL